MKVPVGFYDPPGTQKVTAKDRGDYFVPTQGVDAELAEKEHTRSRKVIKTISLVLVAAVIAGLVIWAIIDPGPKPHIVPIG